jgi:uncharacterized membrane protein YtjA (UPF0391 family)
VLSCTIAFLLVAFCGAIVGFSGIAGDATRIVLGSASFAAVIALGVGIGLSLNTKAVKSSRRDKASDVQDVSSP